MRIRINKINITQDEFEDLLSRWVFDDNGEKTEDDLINYLSFVFAMNVKSVEEHFGEVIENTINYDEDGYIDSIHRLFKSGDIDEPEIVLEFRRFLNKKKIQIRENSDIINTLDNHRGFRVLRKTSKDIKDDEETMYNKYWKYLISEIPSSFNNNDEVDAVVKHFVEKDLR